MWFMMILVLVTLIVGAFSLSDRHTDELANYLSDVNNLRLKEALDAVSGLEIGLLDPELTINDRPYLHHLYDLFMLSPSASDKKMIMDLAYKSIEKGSDVNMKVQTHYEPDLVYKSVYIRNLTMAHAVIDKLRRAQQRHLIASTGSDDAEENDAEDEDGEEQLAALTTVDTLQLLYTLSCDPVPLAKMILHSNNIVQQKIRLEMSAEKSTTTTSTDMNTVAGGNQVSEERIAAMTAVTLKILSTAALVDTSSKFSFTGRELGAFSQIYGHCINNLVRRNYASYNTKTGSFDDHGSNDVTLSELMNILQEMALSVHLSLFSKMDNVEFSNELARLLATPNQKGRNVLHMLAISHSEKILKDIFDILFKIVYLSDTGSDGEGEVSWDGERSGGPSLVKQAAAQLQGQVLNALVQRDIRSHSPLSLARTRFGKEAPVVAVLSNILFLAVTPSKELLLQRMNMFGTSIFSDENALSGSTTADTDITPVSDASSSPEETPPLVEEDFAMLSEILKLADYLSLPLLPKPLNSVRNIDFSSSDDDVDDAESPVVLTGANKFHSYYHWRDYSDAAIAVLTSQWRDSLTMSGGWSEEILPLPDTKDGRKFDTVRASAAQRTRYIDNFPEHNHNQLKTSHEEELEAATSSQQAPQETIKDAVTDAGNAESPTGTLVDDLEQYMRCDIEVVYLSELPSAEEFYRLYVNEARPVIFRGVALNDTIRTVLSKENFVRKYGQERVEIATIPYANTFGVSSSAHSSEIQYATMAEMANAQQTTGHSGVSIKNVHDKATKGISADVTTDSDEDSEYLYTFTTQLSAKLSQDIPVPSCIKDSAIDADGNLVPNSDVELQFYLGPAGSGAPMHVHGNALNTLAYGMKHWFLYPPSDAFYSTQTSVSFAAYDKRAEEALSCTQFGGDVMLVPSLWGHSTLNLKQSIGVAHEFSVESFCMQ